MCKVIKVDKSSYYRWIKAGCIVKKVDTQLNNLIESIFVEGRNNYGTNGVDMPDSFTTAQRMESYQYKRKCIDIEEYMNQMKEMFGGDNILLDDSDIKQTLEQLKE